MVLLAVVVYAFIWALENYFNTMLDNLPGT